MSKFTRLFSFVVSLVLALSSLLTNPAAALADSPQIDKGTFEILVYTQNEWQFQGSFSFNNYETRQLTLKNDAGQLKLRLVQHGHDAAFVDYIGLQKDGKAFLPVSALNLGSNADVLSKVLSPEYDVCNAWNSSLEVVWSNVPPGSTLVLRAMEEDLGENHGGPLYYPWIHLGQTLSYSLIGDGGLKLDGILSESSEPAFKVLWKSTSPHPEGYTYGWLHADADYLYAAVEVTPDNTPDLEDWAAMYIMANGELKEFRVSPAENQWGAAGFQYTSAIPYEHRVYEFKIPLSQIGARIGDTIRYGFGCYGTLSSVYLIKIETSPHNTGSVTFNGTQKLDGSTVPIFASGTVPIIANAGPGYGFYKWQTEGGIAVDDPASPFTNCHLDAPGTLRMVQLPLTVTLWTYNVTDDITDIAVGELTGDSREDVAAIDVPPRNATLHVIYGQGGLIWDKPLDGYSVAVGDIDGDGVNEVIAAGVDHTNPIQTSIFAYENNGTLKWTYNTTGLVKDIEIGDIDSNGKKDVVACNNLSAPGTVYAIDGVTGNSLPGWPVVYPAEDFLDIAVGQLDGLGGMDVAAIGRGVPGSLFVFNSSGGLMWPIPIPIQGRSVEIGDVNGDGANEVVAGTDTGLVLVFAGNNGTQLYSFILNPPGSVTDIELGDLDGNLQNGVEVACISGSAIPVTLYALDIDNLAHQVMWRYNMSWDSQYYGESLAIGDVDKDYKNEVVAASSIIVHRVYAFDGLDNNGDGIGDLVWSPYEVELPITDLEIGDLNGDGVKDVVFGTGVSGTGPFFLNGFLLNTIYAISANVSTTATATGTGAAYFDSDPSTVTNLQPVSEGSLPSAGKPSYNYPHGFFSFEITGLNPGQTANVTVTLPSNAPIGTKWVKYQNGVWSILPIGDDDGDNVITYQVTDGGSGDADGKANGTIVEPGAPGYPKSVGGEVAPVNKFVLLFPWFLAAVAILTGAVAIIVTRRKRKQS